MYFYFKVNFEESTVPETTIHRLIDPHLGIIVYRQMVPQRQICLNIALKNRSKTYRSIAG